MHKKLQDRLYALLAIVLVIALFLGVRAMTHWIDRDGTGRAIGEGQGCGVASADAVEAPYRVGFNMIRTTPSAAPFDTPEEVMADLVSAGAQGMRQLRDRDLSWFQVYDDGPYDDPDSYDFEEVDRVLLNEHGLVTIPTLFQIGPSTAGMAFGVDCPEEGGSESEFCQQPHTPDGDVLDVRDPAVAEAVEGYVRVVAERYRGTGIRYLEILNEPARYKHYDAGVAYAYKWEPARYVDLLELCDRVLAEVDPGIEIVMGGTVYYDNKDTDGRQEMWEDYFDKVLAHGGGAYIDVVNFHYYGAYTQLPAHIAELEGVLEKHGIVDAPIWMTETGSSATVTSEQDQATNLVRLFTVAFGNGVALANWHTHLSSNDGTDSWGGYGVRTKNGRKYLSWGSFQAFADRFGDFARCTILSEDAGLWAYQFDDTGLVMWSENPGALFDVSGLLEADRILITELVADEEGEHASWDQDATEPVALTGIPVVVEVLD